ncbi:MAG: hypothetical protein R6U27_13755 [Desulfobacterales bacterium]
MKNSRESSSKSFWQYVDLNDFKVPEATIDRTVKKRLFNFLHILKTTDKKDSKPLVAKDETNAIEETRLNKIIPVPNWKIPAAALDEALKNWMESQKVTDPFKLIIGPPFSGHSEILSTWAKFHNLKVIISPSADQILNQDISYFKQFTQSDSLWVIPDLEKLFLRHTKGLDLVRRLFNGLFTGEMGQGAIGCDTWAWAFLDHVLKARFFPVMILQAFQVQQMTAFFADVISAGSESHTVFRQTGDGKPVLIPFSLPGSDSQTETKTSPWIKEMTDYCRGNPGIALEYWRQSLRTMASKENNEKPIKFNDDFSDKKTLWVTAWNKLTSPSIPNDLNRDHTRLLYTLLIHGGLSEKLLYRLLPFSIHESINLLRFLESAQIIEKSFEVWRVSPFAFPAVREYLGLEEYPRGL